MTERVGELLKLNGRSMKIRNDTGEQKYYKIASVPNNIYNSLSLIININGSGGKPGTYVIFKCTGTDNLPNGEYLKLIDRGWSDIKFYYNLVGSSFDVIIGPVVAYTDIISLVEGKLTTEIAEEVLLPESAVQFTKNTSLPV